MAENVTHAFADAVVVLAAMDGADDKRALEWSRKAQEELAANPRVNFGVAVQHLLRAAWYSGYEAGKAGGAAKGVLQAV